METPRLTERNKLFQTLKPCCVKISQFAIRETNPSAAARELLPLTRQVLEILENQTQQDPSILDEKLAEYVFFPLFYIFRQVDQYPTLLVETSIKCLTILIVHGWKSKFSPQLVQQVLSLLTYILDGDPSSKTKRDAPEETILEALRALRALFKTAAVYAGVAGGLADSEAIPALGHGITVILEIIVDGATPEIQQEALSTLENLYKALKDQGALANFLPGTISSLTKVLSTPTRYKNKVLAKCLDTVCLTLTRVLGDLQTRSILAQAQKEADGVKAAEEPGKLLSPAWLKATVAQVRLALARIMKIRTHDDSEVRQSLNRLCVTLLDECHTTLSECSDFLVETAIMLDPLDSPDYSRSSLETCLKDLASIYPEIAGTIKATVYNWMSSLPYAMQASDENARHHAITNLTKGMAIVKDLQIESSTLDELLSSTLRDTIVSLISGPEVSQSQQLSHVQLLTDESTEIASMTSKNLGPVLLSHESQRRVKNDMLALLKSVAVSGQKNKLATTMLDYVRETTADNQVAAFWICFEVVKAAYQGSSEDSALLDLSAFDDPEGALEGVFNDLYTFSVQVLDSHTDLAPADWRLEAIALEITSHAAQRIGPAFRPELIDVLFPITTFLGSESKNLQQYAVVTLNNLASACDYTSVSELIIDNVDYMVNTISLRLNTLDVSPASTQVLTMMIQLAGPRVIPYLDDVVESIFMALENYHGYATFVENLFAVLKETVKQGVQSDGLLLEAQKGSKPSHRKEMSRTDGLKNLIDLLDKREVQKKQAMTEDLDRKNSERHPKAPWKRGEEQNAWGDEEDPNDESPEKEEEKKPNTPTYRLLTRITTLTQYYLTSPVPELRRTLLEILTTASSALAADEDSFLPLVNAVWPVVIARLHDEESYVVIEACHALCHLCESAGDFLSTRFKTEWSEGMGKWCRRIKEQASNRSGQTLPRNSRAETSKNETGIILPIRSTGGLEAKTLVAQTSSISSSGLGRHAAPQKIWEAVIKLLTAIISFVRVDDGMFEEILDLLAEAAERDSEVKHALESVNADAVWLVRYRRDLLEKLPSPIVEGMIFQEM